MGEVSCCSFIICEFVKFKPMIQIAWIKIYCLNVNEIFVVKYLPQQWRFSPLLKKFINLPGFIECSFQRGFRHNVGHWSVVPCHGLIGPQLREFLVILVEEISVILKKEKVQTQNYDTSFLTWGLELEPRFRIYSMQVAFVGANPNSFTRVWSFRYLPVK